MSRVALKLRAFGSDLLLIPRMWRFLVQEAREEIAWERDVAASTARRELRVTGARH